MAQQVLSFVFFIQIPCAIFVFMDARRRGMTGFWPWLAGVAFFMPFFLPFYILLRPREVFFYCPKCGSKNRLPVENCRNCGQEINLSGNAPIQGEWKISDAIAMYALAALTLPISVMGMLVALRVMERDIESWASVFSLGLVTQLLFVILPLWFVVKVCRRPLRDIGLVRTNLHRNIALGVILVVPVLVVAYLAEEAVVRTSIAIVPSRAEDIRSLQGDEHKMGGAEIWPDAPGHTAKLAGAIIVIIVLAPVGEEFLFRGIAYNALRRRKRWKALTLTSLLFAVAHIQVIHFVPIFIIGLVLAYLFERTGSLVAPITLHFVVNLLLMFLWYWNPGWYT